jgi:uncharacterized protein (DUF1800 family)
MADLTPRSSWTAEEVLHLGRRAAFGLSPEEAAALAGQPPGAAVDAWVDGTGLSTALFDSVWADRADPVWLPAVAANTGVAGSVDVPAVNAPHRYAVDGLDAWRNDLARAQASWAFRMQYHPHAFAERMALFWHNLFATGNQKVGNAALMLGQIQTLRTLGLARFDDLLVAVSKDPAMAIWLDSVLNNAAGSRVPNENYAREVLELYSLGADNGYTQQDITQLALALSGWSFTVDAAQRAANPASPDQLTASGGSFRLQDGTALAAGTYAWDNLSTPAAAARSMHVSGARAVISFLGQLFDVSIAPAGWAPGEDAVRSIVAARPAQCAAFLAGRLLTHFVTSSYSQADRDDLAGRIVALSFDLRAVMKELLKSSYFYEPAHRYALVEGPVSWTVRAARQLGMGLAAADAQAPNKGFPAWALVGSPYFEQAGMKLLDPGGPNGWKEDRAWLNSNTIRYRTKLAAAVALGEGFSQGGATVPLFPSSVDGWFPAPPADAAAVLARLTALLQPAPIPAAVSDAWLAALWPPATFGWAAADKNKARELALLILCSPSGQLY